MKTLIIQTSPQHTASTFLINALYGLIPKISNKKIIVEWTQNFSTYFEDIIVIKCHDTDIDNLILKYKNNYKLYFISSERSEKKMFIDNKYKSYKNIIIFDYKELNRTNENTIPKIIRNIYNKIQPILNIELNIKSGINRIKLMNARYKEIKHLPFSYIDNFFEIHGSHRNRE